MDIRVHLAPHLFACVLNECFIGPKFSYVNIRTTLRIIIQIMSQLENGAVNLPGNGVLRKEQPTFYSGVMLKRGCVEVTISRPKTVKPQYLLVMNNNRSGWSSANWQCFQEDIDERLLRQLYPV